MTRLEIISLITAIVLGETGEALNPTAIGKNATLNVDGIRI